ASGVAATKPDPGAVMLELLACRTRETRERRVEDLYGGERVLVVAVAGLERRIGFLLDGRGRVGDVGSLRVRRVHRQRRDDGRLLVQLERLHVSRLGVQEPRDLTLVHADVANGICELVRLEVRGRGLRSRLGRRQRGRGAIRDLALLQRRYRGREVGEQRGGRAGGDRADLAELTLDLGLPFLSGGSLLRRLGRCLVVGSLLA